MSSDSQRDGFNKDRAELFEALGHPTRIKMLQVLSDSPLGFSDLKRKVGIESNGLVSFHLSKLNGLVNTTPDGSYALSDEGREALRIITANDSLKNIQLDNNKGKLKYAIINTILISLGLSSFVFSFLMAMSGLPIYYFYRISFTTSIGITLSLYYLVFILLVSLGILFLSIRGIKRGSIGMHTTISALGILSTVIVAFAMVNFEWLAMAPVLDAYLLLAAVSALPILILTRTTRESLKKKIVENTTSISVLIWTISWLVVYWCITKYEMQYPNWNYWISGMSILDYVWSTTQPIVHIIWFIGLVFAIIGAITLLRPFIKKGDTKKISLKSAFKAVFILLIIMVLSGYALNVINIDAATYRQYYSQGMLSIDSYVIDSSTQITVYLRNVGYVALTPNAAFIDGIPALLDPTNIVLVREEVANYTITLSVPINWPECNYHECRIEALDGTQTTFGVYQNCNP